LNGICIYEGVNGKYITFPNKKQVFEGDDHKSKDVNRNKNEIYHPVEKDFADYLKNVIIEGYQKMLEKKSFSYNPDEGEIQDYRVELSDGGEEDSEVSQREITG
jgi:DNA-binding cell septation regulator SpoVG